MERMCEQGADAGLSLVTDERSTPAPLPFSTEEIFALLNVPHDALRNVDAALFLLKQCDMVAYYWRDYSQRPQIKFFSLDVIQGTFGTLPFDSGPLPANALRVGMNAAGRRWLAIFLPPQRRSIVVEDNDYGLIRIEVPLPACIFLGCEKRYWIWSVKEVSQQQVTSQTQLFCAPFSNVESDGSICFGANRVLDAGGETMMQALYLFLDSPFNGHSSNYKSRRYPGDVRFLLKELAGQEHFPVDDLVPMQGRDTTFGQFLPTLLHLNGGHV